MTRAGILVAVLAAALTVASATAAPQRDLLVRPGVGIGKIRLGMTIAQVRSAMRPHDLGVARARGFGVRYLELTWWSGLADHFTVGLLGRTGAERVVHIATSRWSERTSSGIGPGATVARLRRTYPRAQCRTLYPVGGGTVIRSEFVVPAAGRRETVFVRGKWDGKHGGGEEDARYSGDRIVEVIVQDRSERIRATVERC